MSESYYRVIPESEVELEKLAKGKRALELFRKLCMEHVGIDLLKKAEVEFVWIRKTDEKDYKMDQIFFEILQTLNSMRGFPEDVEIRVIKDSTDFYGIFEVRRRPTGKKIIIRVRADIPLSEIAGVIFHELHHFLWYRVMERPPIGEEWQKIERLANAYAKRITGMEEFRKELKRNGPDDSRTHEA